MPFLDQSHATDSIAIEIVEKIHMVNNKEIFRSGVKRRYHSAVDLIKFGVKRM